MLGDEVEVLVEGKNKTGLLKGHTRAWKKVVFQGEDHLIGTLQKVKIHGYNHQTLLADLVTSAQLLVQL